MIDLKAQYEKAGLFMGVAELPDFLPLFLEFLSTLPAQEARDMLGQPAHILAAMAERLRKRGSPYEAVFRALVALAAAKPKEDEVSALLALPDPDASDGCKDGLIARIRGGLRPAPDMPAAAAQTVPPRQ